MKFYLPLWVLLFLGIGSCAPQQEISGPEQRKRVEEYRKKRQQSKSIVGFWQEYKRTISEKRMAERALPFTDTLKLVIKADSATTFFDLHSRTSASKMYYRNGMYHLGNGQSFTSIEKLGDTLRLSHKNQFVYLKKVAGFYMKPFVRPQPDERLYHVESLNDKFLLGKWKVYKKEDDAYNRQKKYLQSINIQDAQADGTYLCEAYSQVADVLVKDSGFLEIEETTMVVELKQQQVPERYKVLKASGDEMILHQEGVKYYLKNFAR